MKNTLLLFAFTLLLSTKASSQGMTYLIDLNNTTSISQNLKALAQAETDFWANTLKLDSVLTAKLESNNFSIYNQYIHVMKYFNFKMEKVLLVEQKNFKDRRNRFMKMFLDEKRHKTYQAIVAKAGKKALKKQKDNASVEIRKMRVEAAGWNVMNQTVNFK